MAEPTSTGVLTAGMAGAGIAGLLAGVDSAAAVGSLCGSVIYFISAKELPLPERLTYFLISFVMGYLLAPAITGIELWGIKPFTLPAPAAFGASLMVVTVSLAALKRRRQSASPNGGIDG
ncbi:putative holin [Stutzerimonas nitrititolerans]|uniref:putative holin n=1 Tax=Stutzerimonas nitrititolerans TaxID=2482751 RepID=UPI0028ABF382|nr:putative holin [Stutzerimonas nitrititolerans]